MDVRIIELMAANKNCSISFKEIAKCRYNGKGIFEAACEHANSGSGFTRTGKRLEIIEINDYSIKVKLTSEAKLEMAAKSLVGFSRELVRIDNELHPDEDSRLFKDVIYNTTLFRNVDITDIEEHSRRDGNLSDAEALKLCVDIYCNNTTSSKEEAAILAGVKKELNEILRRYDQSKRLMSYSKGVMSITKRQ